MIPFSISIFGLLWSRFDAVRLLVFLFLIQFFFLWLVLKYYPNSYSLMGTANTGFVYASIMVIFFKYKSIVSTYLKIFLIFISVFVFLILIQSKFAGVGLNSGVSYFRNFFHSFMILPIVLVCIYENKFDKLFTFITVFFLGIAALYFIQVLRPSLKDFFVIESIYRNGEFVTLVAKQVVLGNPAVGTFIRPANLGNALAIFLPFSFILYKKNYLLLAPVIYWVFFIAFLFVLLSTGIRTSFVSFFIFQVGVFLVFYQKKVFIPLSLVVLAFIMVFLGESVTGYERSDFSNPVLRVFYLLNYFEDTSGLVEGSTLSRSSNIFAYYENFWLGSGVYSSGVFIQGISSLTDLTLAFIFVEYGFLILVASLFLFTFPLIQSFNRTGFSVNNKLLFFLFLALFAQTITDQGFFTNYSSYLYFTVVGFLTSGDS